MARTAKPKLKILYLITDPLSARLLHGQLAYLRELDHQVELGCAPGPLLEAFGRSEGVVVHGLPLTREPAPLHDLRALVATARLIRKLRPDVVNASTPKAGLLGMLAAWVCRVPRRIYVVRGLRFETLTGVRRTIFKFLERLAIACATDAIFNSGSLRATAHAEKVCTGRSGSVLNAGSGNGVALERLLQTHNAAISRAHLGFRDDDFVIGFVGRLVGDKGFADAVEAFSEIAEDESSVRLLVVGEYERGDPVSARLKQAVAADDRIVHTGWLENLGCCYAAMNVLVFPSYREGLPNGPLEAQAAGVPVVGYAATGTVDAVFSEGIGGLVPVGDVRALTAELRRALNGSQRSEAATERARRWIIANFQPEAVWDALHHRLLGRAVD